MNRPWIRCDRGPRDQSLTVSKYLFFEQSILSVRDYEILQGRDASVIYNAYQIFESRLWNNMDSFNDFIQMIEPFFSF